MLEKLSPEWEHLSAISMKKNTIWEIIVGKKVEVLKYDYALIKGTVMQII